MTDSHKEATKHKRCKRRSYDLMLSADYRLLQVETLLAECPKVKNKSLLSKVQRLRNQLQKLRVEVMSR